MDLNPIDVQKHLKGVDYPASAEELASKAESNGAPKEIVDELRNLKEDSISGPDQVMKALKRG